MQIRSEQDMLMDVVRMQGPPADIDLRNGFVGAKQPIARYSRYGPFQGKWTSIPLDKQFAWEVSATIVHLFQVIVSQFRDSEWV